MAREFKTQLAGQIGESLVVAELGRRGIVATAFAGNVPDIDILAYKDGKSIAVQVKAWRAGSNSFKADRFLDIEQRGERQIVRGIDHSLDKNLIFVFVKIGADASEDRFFVITQDILQNRVHDGYKAFLAKHNGIRPKNPLTRHTAVGEEMLVDLEDRWDFVKQALDRLD